MCRALAHVCVPFLHTYSRIEYALSINISLSLSHTYYTAPVSLSFISIKSYSPSKSSFLKVYF